MKKLYNIILFSLFFLPTSLKAQIGYDYTFDRFDSISDITSIKGILDDSSYYYMWNSSTVYRLDKVTKNYDTLYHSSEIIIDAFIDSIGNFGFIEQTKMFRNVNGIWQSENIPAYSYAQGCMVDSSGAIYIKIYADSLLKFDDGIWTKYSLNFLNQNEYWKDISSNYLHECILITIYNSTTYIYKFSNGNLNLLNNIQSYIYEFEFDSLNNEWFTDGYNLKKRNSNGQITTISKPFTGNIGNFKLSKQYGKFWLEKTDYFNIDSLFYFDGINWEFIYTNNESFSLFNNSKNNLLLKNKTSNDFAQNVLSKSYLKTFEGPVIIDSLTFYKPLITGKVNSILAWEPYFLTEQYEFLLATNKGLYLRKYDPNLGLRSYVKIDTSNSNLPTNHVLDMELRNSNNIIAFDNVYLGTNKGIYKVGFDNDSLIIYETINEQNSDLPSDSITKISFDNGSSTNELWIGTKDKGLVKLSSTGFFTLYDTINSLLPSNYIKDITIQQGNICVTTDKGILIINETLQKVFTMTNSSLLTHSINSVGVFQSYYTPGASIYKCDYLVNTNGYGFAIIDTSNNWHYFNTQNLNFDYDTTYFYEQSNLNYSPILLTSAGMFQLYGTANSLSINLFHSFDFNINDILDLDSRQIMCLSYGSRSGILMNNGILAKQECFGSTNDMDKQEAQLKAFIMGNNLFLESNLSGNYALELYDLSGRNIFTKQINVTRNNTFEIPNFAVGIYLIRLMNTSQTHSIKVVNSK